MTRPTQELSKVLIRTGQPNFQDPQNPLRGADLIRGDTDLESTVAFLTSRSQMLHNIKGTQSKMIARSLTAAGIGVVAKIVGVINQVVSVTLISKALGAEGLQEQMLAIASVSWFSLLLCGMHSSLPTLLIRSGGNAGRFASIAKTAYLLAIIGAVAAVGLMAAILSLGLIGGVAAAPIAAATICSGAGLILSLSEKVFLAIDRIAQLNILNMLGTLISLAATVVLARSHGTPAGFVVSFFVGVLFPVFIATFVVIPRLDLRSSLSPREFRTNARDLIGVGAFGFGYEVSSYCKLQAPLVLLGALNLSNEIAPVGLGLRLVGLIIGGLSIVIPILFLRIGTAIHVRDQDAGQLWTRLGIVGAAAVAVMAAGIFAIFGEAIYRMWTSGAVGLDHAHRIALAAFSAVSLTESILFPLAAPDPSIARKLRWLFWLEGPAVLAASVAGAIAVPTAYGGAGMLAGAALVMSSATLVLLVFLAKRSSPQGEKEADGLGVSHTRS
jgi:hypothetical protein